MKKYFVLFLVFVFIYQNLELLSKPKKEKSNQIATLELDCNTIAIYSQITNDCCVEITTSWSVDTTGMSVEFEQMDSYGNYVFVGSSRLPAKHKFCPNPGETVVNYRLKWFNAEHLAACNTLNNKLDREL
jgi:hypothetical protein